MDCEMTKGCDRTYAPKALEVTKSMKVDKTNTLHQFDSAGIIGVPSPVGKIPLVFYIKETEGSGHRGIIYYDDRDTVCYMFPEHKHAEWCKQPYDIKYDKIELHDKGEYKEYYRNYGIFQLWVSTLRKWYNGQVLFRPRLKIQGCGGHYGGYPGQVSEPEPTVKAKVKTAPINIKHSPKSCGCGKG